MKVVACNCLVVASHLTYHFCISPRHPAYVISTSIPSGKSSVSHSHRLELLTASQEGHGQQSSMPAKGCHSCECMVMQVAS